MARFDHAGRLAFAVFSWALGASVATAQCADWLPGFQSDGVDGAVLDQVVFDDGSGAALFVAGAFRHVGELTVPCVARWDGQSWSSAGGPVISGASSNTPIVFDLEVFDEGHGPMLFAAGDFEVIGGVAANRVAKWNGTAWQPLISQGVNGVEGKAAYALSTYDDGGGARLYVGGEFTSAGPWIGCGALAAWDGSSWRSGRSGLVSFGFIETLKVYDSGAGPYLYAAGQFNSFGGAPAVNIARGKGQSWSALGAGLNSRVSDLEVYDDGLGAGPQLIAAGAFTQAGGANAAYVARWNGSAWSTLGAGLGGSSPYAFALGVYDDGAGEKLYVGGTFESAGGAANPVQNLAAWDGVNWSSAAQQPGLNQSVWSFGVFDAGSGPELIAGGVFQSTTDVAPIAVDGLAAWNGSTWSALGANTAPGDTVYALAEHDDGGGSALYVGGSFVAAGSLAVERIARWSPSAGWSAVGSGQGADDIVEDLISFDDDGDGVRELFAAGRFTNVDGQSVNGVARWNGQQWSSLGSGLNGLSKIGFALETYDDGGGEALYVGGRFLDAGGVNSPRIAKWNGATWESVGGGVTNNVYALARFDDGGGEKLIVAGEFKFAGSPAQPANRIAAWDGATWTPLGAGLTNSVTALATVTTSAGSTLYVGGGFSSAGGVSSYSIARWNGSTWSQVGGSGILGGLVLALRAFDDGSGPALFVGGAFTQLNGSPISRIAKWNGSQWSSLGVGIGSGAYTSVECFGVFDPGSGFGPQLWAGGNFSEAGGALSSNLARWGRTCCPPTIVCSNGASSAGCTPTISFTGAASASGATNLAVQALSVDGQRSGLFFYGVSGSLAQPWNATSSLCVKAPTQRTRLQSSQGSVGQCDGAIQFDWNSWFTSHPGSLGSPFAAGDQVVLQGWLRDPASPKGSHLTSALSIDVCP